MLSKHAGQKYYICAVTPYLHLYYTFYMSSIAIKSLETSFENVDHRAEWSIHELYNPLIRLARNCLSFDTSSFHQKLVATSAPIRIPRAEHPATLPAHIRAKVPRQAPARPNFHGVLLFLLTASFRRYHLFVRDYWQGCSVEKTRDRLCKCRETSSNRTRDTRCAD